MIQPPRLPVVFGTVPAPMAIRLPKWVRSGPRTAVNGWFCPNTNSDPSRRAWDTPRMVWHATHAEDRNTWRPRASSDDVGAAASLRSLVSQVWKSAGVWATTYRAML